MIKEAVHPLHYLPKPLLVLLVPDQDHEDRCHGGEDDDHDAGGGGDT